MQHHHHPQEETASLRLHQPLAFFMATTPFFLWATKPSSSSSSPAAAAAVSDHDVVDIGAEEETAAAVARPRLRRQASSPAKQQQQQQVGGGGSKKPPQRGLGVAELERLRCGGDPLRDLNAAVAAMGDAAAVIHHHLPVPAFDADAGGRGHYAPLLVRPAPPSLPPPPAAPLCYLHSSSAGGHNVAPPELQFLRDRCMGGFVGAGHGPPQLMPLAPEHPSSQSNTIWRPAPSSSSCLPTGHRCDLCSKTMMRALAERGARGATTTTTTPDYSIYDLAAAMATARKEKGQGLFLGRERKNEEAAAAEKEVREIEFFPTSTSHADESEFATTAPFSSSAGGGCGVPLDLSLRL